MNTKQERTYDLSEFIEGLLTADNTKLKVRDNFVRRRKQMKLTQKKLSEMSCVSYASLRRFEETGEISFDSLLRLAERLECLDEFVSLFPKRKHTDLKEEFDND